MTYASFEDLWATKKLSGYPKKCAEQKDYLSAKIVNYNFLI